eukprot:364026-Chlamydomonas_euryale.AAC.1
MEAFRWTKENQWPRDACEAELGGLTGVCMQRVVLRLSSQPMRLCKLQVTKTFREWGVDTGRLELYS